MKKKYFILVSTAITLPIVLFIAHSLKSHPQDTHPILEIHAGKATGVKTFTMNITQLAYAQGDERRFLREQMFAAAPEYPSFALIQKEKNYLGVMPTSFQDVEPFADFEITVMQPMEDNSRNTMKTFFKLQYFADQPEATVVAIPELRLSQMGKVAKKDWKTPNAFGFSGTFPYYFKLIVPNTPAGDIVYRVFVSEGSRALSAILERYMKLAGLPLLR